MQLICQIPQTQNSYKLVHLEIQHLPVVVVLLYKTLTT
jgi:hypothetical protein